MDEKIFSQEGERERAGQNIFIFPIFAVQLVTQINSIKLGLALGRYLTAPLRCVWSSYRRTGLNYVFFYLLLQFLASCVCFAKKFNLRCLSRLNLFADLLLPGGEKCAKQFQSARDFGHWKVRYSGIKVVGLNICLFSALFWSLKTDVRVLTGIIFLGFFIEK